MTEPLADPPPSVEPAGTDLLPSARLLRLSELAAAEVAGSGTTAAGPVLSEQALRDVLAAVDASTSPNTKAAYRSDWGRFTTWAKDRGFAALPADPLVVAHYLTEAAAEMTGVGKWRYTPTTLTRWVSSINQFHTAAGLDAPGRAEVVRRALSGVRRIRATPQVRRTPLLLDDIRTLLAPLHESTGSWPAGVAARRDMAILLMGFAGASRRSELVALTLSDLTQHPADGLHMRLRRSKTDQEAHGQVKALPYGRDPVTCPPCAYVRWRQVLHAWDTAGPTGRRRAVMTVLRRQATATEGADGDLQHCCRRAHLPDPANPERALFPRVHAAGAIGGDAMTGQAVTRMIQRRAEQAGFAPAQIALLGGHSLRSGFVTEAFRAGADAHAIMRQTGHRTPGMLEVYAREHSPLMGNAVTHIGL